MGIGVLVGSLVGVAVGVIEGEAVAVGVGVGVAVGFATDQRNASALDAISAINGKTAIVRCSVRTDQGALRIDSFTSSIMASLEG